MIFNTNPIHMENSRTRDLSNPFWPVFDHARDQGSHWWREVEGREYFASEAFYDRIVSLMNARVPTDDYLRVAHAMLDGLALDPEHGEHALNGLRIGFASFRFFAIATPLPLVALSEPSVTQQLIEAVQSNLDSAMFKAARLVRAHRSKGIPLIHHIDQVCAPMWARYEQAHPRPRIPYDGGERSWEGYQAALEGWSQASPATSYAAVLRERREQRQRLLSDAALPMLRKAPDAGWYGLLLHLSRECLGPEQDRESNNHQSFQPEHPAAMR